MNALKLKDVSTNIGEEQILKDISFTLKKEQVLALTGHNGSGKSTLLKTILRTLEKRKGTIQVIDKYDQDETLIQFKQEIAYLPEEPMLMSELTILQHFQLYGMSYHIPHAVWKKRVVSYLEQFELTDKANDYPTALSKGMRQKAQAICALLPDTPVLLVDEPFVGLDVYAIDFLVNELRRKKREGTGIILSTHQLDKLQDIADDFLMLHQGEVVETGTIEEFSTILRRSE